MWLSITLVCAMSVAIGDSLAKRSNTSDDPMVMAAGRFAISLPFLWAMLPFIEIPQLGPEFWPTFGTMVPFEILAGVLYVGAIRLAPLSVTLPLLAFTPVLVVLSGAAILNERLAVSATLGIAMVCAGAYFLHIDRTKGFLEPLKALVRQRGSRWMLAVAAIYAYTSVAGKKAVLASSPAFFVILYFTVVTVLLVAILPVTSKGKWRDLLKPDRDLVLAGVMQAIMVITHSYAIVMVQAAYFMSIKRMSILFGVALGALVFKEVKIGKRLAAAGLMVAGAAVILLTK
jgi:drug/metabolite transporter (DMT)-like permease